MKGFAFVELAQRPRLSVRCGMSGYEPCISPWGVSEGCIGGDLLHPVSEGVVQHGGERGRYWF